MPATLVVQKQCERCPRIDSHEVTLDEVKNGKFSLDTGVSSLKIEVDGTEIGNFGYLCETCREITSRYVQQCFRQLDKISSLRERKSSDEEVDVDVEGEAAE